MGTPGRLSRHDARGSMAMEFGRSAVFGRHDSMDALIQEIRSASAAVRAIPRSTLAARLRTADADVHGQLARRRWANLRQLVHTSLYVRRRWHSVVVATSLSDATLLEPKVDWRSQPGADILVQPLTVESMLALAGLHDIPRLDSAGQNDRKYVLPISARPPWQRFWDPPTGLA